MEVKNIQSHRDLIVWQKSITLTVAIYQLCEKLPSSEKYGITSQMKRAAVSIPANIAEGRRGKSRADFANFLRNAYGSAIEMETYLCLLPKLFHIRAADLSSASNLLTEILKMLNVLTAKFSSP